MWDVQSRLATWRNVELFSAHHLNAVLYQLFKSLGQMSLKLSRLEHFNMSTGLARQSQYASLFVLHSNSSVAGKYKIAAKNRKLISNLNHRQACSRY
jgi:hypothetical protein